MSHFYFGANVNGQTVFSSPVGIVCLLCIIILDKEITRAQSVNDSYQLFVWHLKLEILVGDPILRTVDGESDFLSCLIVWWRRGGTFIPYKRQLMNSEANQKSTCSNVRS